MTNLTLPRMVVGTHETMRALGQRGVASPGMFVVNADDSHLYQWVMDHWEGVGAWAPGGHADDPLAGYQAGRPGWGQIGVSGGHATGGGGGTPAPRRVGDPSVTTPQPPVFIPFGGNDVANEIITTNYTIADGLVILTTVPLGTVPAHLLYAAFQMPFHSVQIVPGNYRLRQYVNGVLMTDTGVFAAGLFAPDYGQTFGAGDPFLANFVTGAVATATLEVFVGTWQITSIGGFAEGGGY